MFHAGESEAHGIAWIRWLILVGRHAEARQLLGVSIREAAASRRRRRELKLRLLNALAYAAAGRGNLAGRALLEALEIGAAGGFLRMLLDERAPAITLLKQLRSQHKDLPREVAPDAIRGYLDRLLIAAGEVPEAESLDVAVTGNDGLVEALTQRERKLLGFVAAGLSNRDLADRLSVSTNTVKWHLRNIFDKLRIRNRVQAIALARRLGLID